MELRQGCRIRSNARGRDGTGEGAIAPSEVIRPRRSIPACAGNSVRSRFSLGRFSPVHPRVCGEQGGSLSSPWVYWRSIPACAGNSGILPQRRELDTGPSPRVRGTGDSSFCCIDLGFGPSPRVRGTGDSSFCCIDLGFGPSPRVRGTVSKKLVSTKWKPGPSPRVRGTGCTGATVGVLGPRSIPACAGNRSANVVSRRRRSVGPSPRVRGTDAAGQDHQAHNPVHPRVCGEQVFFHIRCRLLYGPSPRVRGTEFRSYRRLMTDVGPSPRVRGTAPWPARSPRPCLVHPRVCGEQSIDTIGQAATAAVHPRVCGEQV